ncbi:MAG: SDR family oxidoreductase [Bacteroidetes bacterium]|nr:SDR family oxidoreductase [Bacteroidota bacterium]
MLNESTILVTGGGRGIGAAIAEAFARTHARVVITGRSTSALTAQEDVLREAGAAAVLGVTADISQAEQVDHLYQTIHDAFGAVDVLVANAGVQGPIGPLEDASPEDFAEALAVNLTGTWLCMRSAILDMKAKHRGKIITLSGGGATGPRERFAAYAASKAAVVRLTETAAAELRSHHIDVNAIAPGAVNTRMLDEVLAAGDRAGAELTGARDRAEKGGTPPDRAAELAVFLASSFSDGITGKLLSAVWDPWQDAAFAERLRSDPDFCTLRRIDGKHFRSTDT